MVMEAEEILKRLSQFPQAALGYYQLPWNAGGASNPTWAGGEPYTLSGRT